MTRRPTVRGLRRVRGHIPLRLMIKLNRAAGLRALRVRQPAPRRTPQGRKRRPRQL